MSMFTSILGDMWGDYADSKAQRAYEMADEWRREFYRDDAAMAKALRAIKMHPESYAMGMYMRPDAYYEHELKRAKYEMGQDLARLLGSRKPCRIQAAFMRLSEVERCAKGGKARRRKGSTIIFGRGAYGV